MLEKDFKFNYLIQGEQCMTHIYNCTSHRFDIDYQLKIICNNEIKKTLIESKGQTSHFCLMNFRSGRLAIAKF